MSNSTDRRGLGPMGESFAPALGVLGIGGVAVASLAAVLPRANVDPLFVGLPLAVMALIILPTLLLGVRVPLSLAEAFIGLGIIFVGIAIHLGGGLVGPLTLFFVWISLVAFCYFPFSHAMVHEALIVITAGVVSAGWPASPSYVVLVGGSTLAIGIWIRRLVDRLNALNVAEADRSRAEVASRAKTEFLSRMSHELRTPLSAVLGFTELLFLEELSPRQREAVVSIGTAGDHLLAVINEVLEISLVEERRALVEHEPVDVAPLITKALDRVRGEAAARNIALPEGADWPGTVIGDRDRIGTILDNLVANAVHYNKDDGAVSVTVSAASGQISLAVSDTGPGLTETQVGYLFIPFERLDAPSRRIEGTGLGLALCRVLAEAMDGSVSVESVPGHGSTFSVKLPESVPAMAEVTG